MKVEYGYKIFNNGNEVGIFKSEDVPIQIRKIVGSGSFSSVMHPASTIHTYKNGRIEVACVGCYECANRTIHTEANK